MKKILVVDDSKVIRMVVKKILQELEFDIEEATDGEQALESCRTSMPDGILLDWYMPGMDGKECLIEIRKLPGGDSPIVIFCTSEADKEKIGAIIEAGANEYIVKPFDKTGIHIKFDEVGLLSKPGK